jgi:hypothetical protein
MKKANRLSRTVLHGTDVIVLVAADIDRSRKNLPSAYQLAQYRLGRRQWGLKNRTRYRATMKKGQRVLIYISGHREFAQHFVAEARLASDPKPALGDRILDAPDFSISLGSEYKLDLKSVQWFKKPVCARDLIGKFSFIAPNRVHMWRIYFQGGALRIPTKDADLVLKGSR